MNTNIEDSKYSSTGNFIIRSPIFPIDNFENSSENILNIINKLICNSFFLDNIILASPELYERIIQWRTVGLTKESELKLFQSVFKYWIRMSTRCTPYGGFAGISIGNIGSKTDMVYNDLTLHTYYSRLDTNCIAELVEKLNKETIIGDKIYYFPNNTLYQIANYYRYIEFSVQSGSRKHQISEIASSIYIDNVLNEAKSGVTKLELVKSLIGLEIGEEEAKEFIEDLISSKILVSDLEPTITGNEFFEVLIKKLSNILGENELIVKLKSIQSKLSTKNLLTVQEHKNIKKIIQDILPEFKGKDLIQSDLYLSGNHITINQIVIDDIIKSIAKIILLGGVKNNDSAIDEFVTKFHDRFEGIEVPLAHALDTETGVGYGDFTNENTDKPNLLQELEIVNKGASDNLIKLSRYIEFQQKKLFDALIKCKNEIIITDAEIDALIKDVTLNTHESMYVLGTLLGSDSNKIDKLNYEFLLHSCGGPSAAVYLGRFCYGNSHLTEKLKEYLSEEESHNPESIYAEIVHLPHSRTGNVIMRPALRTYEIPYVTNGSVRKEYQIPISDLFLRIHKGELILKSKSLNKRVIPRLSNAHNTSSSTLPMYRFLTDLQFYKHTHQYYWHWGEFSYFSYLPRVRFGKIILAPAQWHLLKKEHDVIKEFSLKELRIYFEELSTSLKIPRYVHLSEGELVIDLKNEHCLLILRDELFKKGAITFKEFLASSENCFVTNTKNSKFTNELLIPIKKKNTSVKNGSVKDEITNVSVCNRIFIPGSEWYYVKIYSGTKTAERILKEIIRPLTQTLLQDKIIDKWFFIRYKDPNHHIRIRFYKKNQINWSDVINKLHFLISQYVESGLIQKIQIDTYQREIERYGHNTIEHSEQIFYHDSEAVINFIDLIQDDENEKYRWLLALRSIDMFLSDFNFSTEDKFKLFSNLEKNFSNEFFINEIIKKQISDKYRKHTKIINSILDPTQDSFNEIEEAIEIFQNRSIKTKPILENIKIILDKDCTNSVSLNTLASSYIHMFLNRLFEANQRKQEWIIYNFLFRYYKSVIAVNSKKTDTIINKKN